MEINVCFVCDDGYAMPTCVTIYSMLKSKKEDNFYNIFILCKNVSEQKQSKFMELNTEKFKINIINIEEKEDFSKYKIDGIPATPTAIYKFFIPEILGKTDKVLYLDGDIIVQKDLENLFKIDINNYYIGAVKDSIGFDYKFNDCKYFNSGVMLLNLNKMRQEKVSEKLIEYRKNGFNKLMDQDTFNYVFNQNTLLLPFEYNTQINKISYVLMYDKKRSFEKLKEYWNISNNINSANQVMENATIIHYTTAKPWKFYDIYYSDCWFKNYIESPYGQENLCRNSFYSFKILNSTTYKIGSSILYTPRKIKSLINSIKEKKYKKNKKYKVFLKNFK